MRTEMIRRVLYIISAILLLGVAYALGIQVGSDSTSTPVVIDMHNREEVLNAKTTSLMDNTWMASEIYDKYYSIGYGHGSGRPLHSGPQIEYATIGQVLAWYAGYLDGISSTTKQTNHGKRSFGDVIEDILGSDKRSGVE